jgi:hypothetical protein
MMKAYATIIVAASIVSCNIILRRIMEAHAATNVKIMLGDVSFDGVSSRIQKNQTILTVIAEIVSGELIIIRLK